MTEFAADEGIKFAAEPNRVDRNPNMDSASTMDHWRVTLKHHTRTYTLTFSKGIGHKGEAPTLAEVLECLAMDASSEYETFEDWCADTGYDSDSRKAEKIYSAVMAQTEAVRRLIGHEAWDSFISAAEGV